jgi:hypothetical protein
MGYRQYLYEVDKNLVEEIRKCKTQTDFLKVCKKHNIEYEEYEGEDAYVGLYNLGKPLFEFGKYYDNSSEMYKHGDSLFTTQELNEKFYDYGAIILDKEGLICAIEWQRDRIISIYEDLLKEKSSNEFDERNQFDRMKEHIQSHLRWWKPHCGLGTAYTLDECPNLVNSWLYEHTIFDLVRIYKTFDWENKCLMFLGW